MRGVLSLRGRFPLPYYQCDDFACSTSSEVIGQSSDPAQPYGFDYCNPSSPNFTPNLAPGGSCVHHDYYDPAIVSSPVSPFFCVQGDALGGCSTYLTDLTDTQLNFFDAPSD